MPLPYLTPLTAPALAAHGIPPGWSFGMADRVRFGELDALNHVNNTVYLRWFETLRVAYVQDYGISDYLTQTSDPEIVVRDLAAHFHKPMVANEPYIVTARTTAFRKTSFTMEYGVYSGDLRATGSAVIVCLKRDGSGRWPLPEQVRDRFKHDDGAEDHSQ